MGTVFTVVSATLLVVGAILLLSHLARGRLGMGESGNAANPELRVVRRVGIGPRQGVALLEVGGRRFLVSCGDGGVRLLSEVEGDGGTGDSRAVEAASGVGALPLGQAWRKEGGRSQDGRPQGPLAYPGAARLQAALGGLRAPAWLRRLIPLLGLLVLSLVPEAGTAGELAAQVATEPAVEVEAGGLPQMELRLGGEEDEGGLRVSGPVGAVLLIGFMTLIPTLLLLMTSFTRILIVLHLLKQALGAQAAPPAHVLTALALLLTGFVMAPTLTQVNQDALGPWMGGEMDEVQMLQTASVPMREFMTLTTRDEDLALFLDLWGGPVPEELEEIPLLVVASAFVTSELRAAFQMGFALFLPFIVIDLVVASVLMSMGMFMLPPLMVSLPFKLLLFVLVDGWSLVVGSLVQSFR